MSRERLSDTDVRAWLARASGWEFADGGIHRAFKFATFADAFAFATRVAFAAERRNHHPDLEVGWGRASVRWTTHDAGGVTSLDLELATETAGIFERWMKD